jgi:hypothetical protein
MNKSVHVDVVNTEGVVSGPWELVCSQLDCKCTITAIDPSGSRWAGVGPDWFEALRDLRVTLEQLGLRPLCAGARVDVGQSRMLADSTLGEYVYVLRPGRTPTETVWIFDSASPNDVVSVADQEASYERWLAAPTRVGVFEPVRSLFKECWLRIRYR